MKIGILTASISRQAGGLFWAVRAIAQSLQNIGCELRVYAAENSFTSQNRVDWSNIPLQVANRRGPAAFGYQVGLWRALTTNVPDVVHVHGLWMYPSVAAAAWGRRGKPYVISPHGMLDPWALRNAYWKKRLAGLLYENAHLRGASCIHALCASEYHSIRAYGLGNPVAVIPNGVNIPQSISTDPVPQWAALLPPETRVLLFLSRIHPKKGLVNLLQAWQIAKLNHPAGKNWQMVIAGWEQDGHQTELKKLVGELDIASTVHFIGPQFKEEKAACLARADAFILPSFSEGLPMVVLEAWSYGLPVLMTPQCNIPLGVARGAALEVEALPESIAHGLQQLFAMSETARKSIGEAGLTLVKEQFSWPKIAAEMKTVYEWVLDGGQPPVCLKVD